MILPAGVERLLWEYDLDALREAPELPEVVLERVMARGGWEEMRWRPWFEMKDRLADKRGAYDRPAKPGLRGRARDLPKRELLRHRPYRLAESPPRSS